MATFIENSSAGKISTLMGASVRLLMQFEPGLAGLALWVRFVDVPDGDYAYTDGSRVCACPKFGDLSPAHRAGVTLHELLHVGLAHPARFRRMKAMYADFDPMLANIAADALINAAITSVTRKYSSRVSLPDSGVNLISLLKRYDLPFAELSETEAASKWSLESLYAALKNKGAQSSPTMLTAGMDVDADGEGGGQESGCAEGDKQKATRRALSGVEADEADRGEVEAWSRRMASLWGAVPGLKETLIGEIPKTLTPWEPILRSYLVRALGKPGRTNFSHPARRWTALEGPMRESEGISLPFEPARNYPKKAGRIAVTVDTSGSITDELLARFTAEVATIMKQTNSTVLLLCADTKVTSRVELKGIDGERALRNFRYVGRGGTDFRPALEEMAAWKPDVAVYLTDLMGPTGETAPKYPLLWALLPGFEHASAPFGRLVNLK